MTHRQPAAWTPAYCCDAVPWADAGLVFSTSQSLMTVFMAEVEPITGSGSV